MWLKKCTCFLLACVAVFGCLFTPVAAAELGEQKVEIEERRASGKFDFDIPAKTLMKASSSFPMEYAPAPDPHGEIVTVYWYVDENGNTVTYNPAERKTATGNAGTATIYWVDAHMVTWGITSNAGGAMVFTGTVSTNRGQIFVLGDIEFDGDCGGTIDNVTTLKGKNTATLSGFMIDSRGISITAPDVSSNYYR